MKNIKHSSGKDRKTRKPPKKITESYIHNAGLYYLQRFSAGSAHFRKIMIRKIDVSCRVHSTQERDECIKMLDSLIEKFQNVGLLNDPAYAQTMVISLRRKGCSRRLIQSKLMAKSLEEPLISESLVYYDGEHGENSELVAALRFARRKRFGVFGQSRERDKALAALARAGFSYNIASQALDMAIEEAESLLTQ